jgi:hypothetical protein
LNKGSSGATKPVAPLSLLNSSSRDALYRPDLFRGGFIYRPFRIFEKEATFPWLSPIFELKNIHSKFLVFGAKLGGFLTRSVQILCAFYLW